jgi:hypothetical protein
MKRRLATTVITGAALLAQSGLLLTSPAGVKVTPLVLAENKSNQVTVAKSDRAEQLRVSEAYGKLPLSFEQNQGQTDRKVKFLSRGQGYTLFLTPTEAVLSLRSEKAAESDSEKGQPKKREMQSAGLKMRLVGANASPKMEGRELLQGKSNYLIGNDRKKWRTDVPNYARVQYDEVYPGIDLVYYGNQRRLEYDFVVSPGADPKVIRLNFDGADEMSLDADGSLRLKLKGGEVTQPAPVIYQRTESGERQQIAGNYILKGDGDVVFEVAEYDRSRELVIDPQILYATYYGGSGLDLGNDIAVDGSGNAYITGDTQSAGLSLKGAFDGTLGGSSDAFVVKLNPTGTDIIYATYLGGSFSESAEAIAITSDGKACVTGSTSTDNIISDFPTTASRFQNGIGLPGGRTDAFLSVLAPTGNILTYSTFFRGDQAEGGNGIAVDAANNVYITGETFSEDLPTKNAFQPNRAGTGNGRDAFIAKFNPSQSGNSSLIYSSFLGGSNGAIAGDFANAIAVTPSGVAFMVGATDAANFPTKSSSSLPPFQTNHAGVEDAFIAKVSPSGALIYATLFGGNGTDKALSVAVDSDERAYVTGFTDSSAATFDLKNAFDSTRDGPSDAFVAKFNADGTALFYSSFLGGTSGDQGNDIAVDAGGNVYLTGFTDSGPTNFPELNGLPSNIASGEIFITKIEASDATGTTTPKILYSDRFGGAIGTPRGFGIALDGRGGVYLTGDAGPGLQTTPGAFQGTSPGGSNDAFVVKISSTFPDTIGVLHSSAFRGLQFQLRNSTTAGPFDLFDNFGQAGDQALAGDWDGDGVDNVGVFRPSTAQFLLRQPTRVPPTNILVTLTRTINFGLTGDKAVVGDWNGDGIDTPGVFRNGQFLLTNGLNTNGSTPPTDLIFNFGPAAASPVAGDWNGDGVDTIGTFNAGSWALRNSNSAGAADITVLLGTAAGSLPVVGDWNGDGVDTIGVLATANFFGATTFALNNVNANTTGIFDILAAFGADGDVPIAGDWDGKPANTPPDSGVNNPAEGSSRVGQTQVFTTTCSDPDGWRDIRSIDFKIAHSRSAGRGRDDHDDDRGRHKDDWRDRDDKNEKHDDEGPPVMFWVRFDENRNVIRFYDPDLEVWRESVPGANIVLESRYARLHLSGTAALGSGPLGPSVQITWTVVFKEAAKGSYKQFLKITDDTGSSTGFDRVGSWKVKR